LFSARLPVSRAGVLTVNLNTKEDPMKSKKLTVSILSVVVCGLFAFSIGLQAQSSQTLRLRRGAPIRDVAKFQSAFTERLNQETSSGANLKGNWIAGKKVYKDFVDYFLIHTETARVAKKDLVQLSDDELKELGDLVKNRYDQAIRTKKTSSLGEGQIGKTFFTGKVLAEPGR
jgi:hypothetical protein